MGTTGCRLPHYKRCPRQSWWQYRQPACSLQQPAARPPSQQADQAGAQVRIDLRESSVLENPAGAAGDSMGNIREDEEYVANGTS